MGSKKPFDMPTQKDIEKNKTISELTNTLKEEIKKKDDFFKDIPTPVNFAKLETDVKHHGNLIYGMLITVIIGLIGGYSHFDSKITTGIKSIEDKYRHLEDKIHGDIKTMNGRVDSIIIPDLIKTKKALTQTTKGQEKGQIKK